MTPFIGIFDNFIDRPDDAFNDIVLAGQFGPYRSGWDGVTYPGINAAIPEWVASFIEKRLCEILGKEVLVTAMFARLTTEGTSAPHKVHSDKIMGQYSLHLYLSQEWPPLAGTSFWTHETQGYQHTDKTDEEIVARDQNYPSRWSKAFACQGKFNRALLHDACLFHAAEPFGGFGKGLRDGRVVLTTFFSEAEA